MNTEAFAQTRSIATSSRPFSGVGNDDLAKAWIDYLFRGNAMPDSLSAYAAPLSFAATGLREALGLYSVAMLILAAMLVFYHLAAMVAETAHTGVPFGRRTNQIWMPIRFVLAIGFLVPVSSSLSAGQYLIIRIAGEGSALASNAWRTIANVTNGHLSGLATPHGPDVAHFAATAVEMEICRAVYQQLYTPLDNDTAIHMAGDIGDAAKLPADRFMPETWRYTNLLNASVPLCGEYRFAGFRRPLYGFHVLPDAAARMAQEISDFAHVQANDMQSSARNLGDREAAIFLSSAAPIGADIHNDLATMEKTYTDRLDTEKRQLAAAGDGLADQIMADSTDAGWIAAASFIPEFVRLQTSYSELVAHALPETQEPIFMHQRSMQKVLADAMLISPYYAPLNGAVPEKLSAFYNQNSRINTQIHSWLYSSQLPDGDFAAPSSGDLIDHLNAATDSEATSSFLAEALDSAAFSSGVWGQELDKTDTGYPFAALPSTVAYNPFAALVEFGRRQTDLATKLAGLAGTGIANPGAAGPSVLFGLGSLLFFLGGVLLIFIVPLMPFLRFLIAALAWGINVFEAVVSVPIVALAHLTPVGGGLSGNVARQAYMLWLGLLVRPIMTLFGLMIGLLLFTLGLAFIDAILTPFAHLAVASNGGLLSGANAGLVLLYDVLAFATANVCFKGISWLPDQALRWTSQFVVTDAHDANTMATNPGAGAGYSSVTAFLAPSGSGGGTANVNVTASGGAGGTGGTSANNAAMTAALFPAYGDPAVARDHAIGATTSVSTTSSHLTDRSSPGGASSVNVNLTTSGTSGSARSADYTASRPSKNKLSGGDNEATIGGKERGANDRPATNDTPKE